MIKPPSDLKKFESLLQIVEDLRGPNGCPWDKEQNHRSLAPFAIEEAYELAEAIEQGQKQEMVEELGDLLLQVLIHSEIGRQEVSQDKHFTFSDVVESIASKMVRRHPHVFSNTEVADSNEVLNNWSKIKAQEKANRGAAEPVMRFDISTSFPALFRAHKIGDKSKRKQFDWSTPEEVLVKVEEEIAELKEVMLQKDKNDPRYKAELEHELGDVLFSVAQLARHLKLEAEQCLRTANSRFESRFFTMKKLIEDRGLDFESLSYDELESSWQEAKKMLSSKK